VTGIFLRLASEYLDIGAEEPLRGASVMSLASISASAVYCSLAPPLTSYMFPGGRGKCINANKCSYALTVYPYRSSVHLKPAEWLGEMAGLPPLKFKGVRNGINVLRSVVHLLLGGCRNLNLIV